MNIDMTQPSAASPWFVVNDGVMGGRSSGAPQMGERHMIYSGVINTNGGGFSSIRYRMTPGELAGVDGLYITARGDGRNYKLSLRTKARYRGRLVAFQTPIPIGKTSDFQTVFASFDNMNVSLFGRALSGIDFKVEDVTELGIIIADGTDGPFRLEMTRISDCET